MTVVYCTLPSETWRTELRGWRRDEEKEQGMGTCGERKGSKEAGLCVRLFVFKRNWIWEWAESASPDKNFFYLPRTMVEKIFLYNLLLFMKHWQRQIATVKEMAALLWRRKFNKGQRERESSFLTPQWDSLSVISIMFKLPNHPSQGQMKNGSLHCGRVRSFTSPVSGRLLDHIYKVEMKSQGHTGTLYLNVIFHMSSVWINRQ